MGFLTGRRSGGCLGRLLVVGISLAAAAQSQSVTAEAHSESEIKSAMLYNFAKFVEWPEGALGGAGTPLVAGVVGDTVMVSALEETLRNRTVDGHPLRVRRLSSAADLKICAILLVGSSDRTEIAKILQSVGQRPILTIGEDSEFSRLGGIIAFVREGNRVRFEINLDAAERARFQVSSKLLRLAMIWRESSMAGRN
ncbi:MAG: YfiR family protein [Bryobacteraceae bacterium]